MVRNNLMLKDWWEQHNIVYENFLFVSRIVFIPSNYWP